MGFIVERINHQLEAMWVGHDSLGESMTAFFKPKHEIFDTSLKIMLVLNQCNLRHIYGYHIAQAIEIKISFDYYKLNGDKYELIYQQYFIHKENTKLVRNAAKAITIAFSETVKLAMEDFNKQIALKTSLPVKELMADSLLGFLYKKQSQEVTNQNIKDGIYFSCKDLYLNKPSTFKDFSFNVSANRENPLNLNTKNYIIEKAYAIVKEKRIFIFISDNYYKEALLSDDRILYFPDVTRTSLSKSARANSAAVGVAGAILPLGFLGGLVTAMAQSEHRQKQT
jgi:hypothetical protein